MNSIKRGALDSLCPLPKSNLPDMKTLLAVLACAALVILYAVLGAFLGWKHGGGAIPILILIAAIVGLWKAINRTGGDKP